MVNVHTGLHHAKARGGDGHYVKTANFLFKLTSNDLVLDIGCNDGVLLNNYPLNINKT